MHNNKISPAGSGGGFSAPAGAGGGISRFRARVTFVFGDKSNQKRHLKLRFKTSLRGAASANLTVLISRNWYGGRHCRFRGLLIPLAPLPLTQCEGRGLVRWTVWAIIKSRQSRPEGGFGRWRLTPPRYWGCRLRAGTGVTPHPSRLRRATCLPAGRSVRGSDRPPACHSTPRPPQGEGLRVRGRWSGPGRSSGRRPAGPRRWKCPARRFRWSQRW